MHDQEVPAQSRQPARFSDDLHTISFRSLSVDLTENLMARLYAPVRVHTLGQHLSLDVHGSLAGGMAVLETVTPTGLCFEPQAQVDQFSLSLVRAGTLGMTCAGQAVGQQLSRALVIDAQQIQDMSLSPGLHHQQITIETSWLMAALTQLADAPVKGRLRFGELGAAHARTVALISSLSQALSQGLTGDAPLRHAPAALESLRQSIVGLMLQGLPHNHSEPLRRAVRAGPAPRHVKRAIEFMLAHAQEPLTLAHIAAAAAVSPRALQEGFRRFRAQTPMECLREIRLRGARQDLLDAEQPALVAPIARRWGFGHLGLFAARYQEAFGETPRHTLLRR